MAPMDQRAARDKNRAGPSDNDPVNTNAAGDGWRKPSSRCVHLAWHVHVQLVVYCLVHFAGSTYAS